MRLCVSLFRCIDVVRLWLRIQDLSDAHRFKLVVVGDGAVGKTSLLISFSTGKFPSDYVPTVFENYTATLKQGSKNVLLHLWDTAGQEDYDRLRPLSYPGTDVVLLCFSVCNRNSYESVKEKWFPEVSHHLPSTPFILVGTKTDLRDAQAADPNSNNPEKFEQVTKDEGKKLAQELECVRYMEVSAKTRNGLEALFTEAVKVVMENLGLCFECGCVCAKRVASVCERTSGSGVRRRRMAHAPTLWL